MSGFWNPRFFGVGIRVLGGDWGISCMAPWTFGDSDEDVYLRRRCQWTENRKVYTRRNRKKATCGDNCTTATADTPADIRPKSNGVSAAIVPATVADAPAHITTPNGVSTATVPTAVAEVSTAEDSCNCVSSSPLVAANGSILETASPDGIARGNAQQESRKAAVTEDERLQHHEDSVSQGPPDRNGDSSRQQPRKHEQLDQFLCCTEDGYSARIQVQTAEQPNLEGSTLPESNEVRELGSPSTPHSASELLPMSGDEARNLISNSPVSGKTDLPNGTKVVASEPPDSSPVSGETDMPNGMKVVASEPPDGNGTQNDGDWMPGSPQVPEGNGLANVNRIVKPLVISRVDDRIRFNLCKAISKSDIKDFAKKLEGELNLVRRLVTELDSKEVQLASCSTQVSSGNLCNGSNYISPEGADIVDYGHPQPQPTLNSIVDRRFLLKMNPEVSYRGHEETRLPSLLRMNSDMGGPWKPEPRPYIRQLSVSVMENNSHSSDFFEKEKRMPKANQYYRNSEFLLGKDRLPLESNKRLKTNNGRKYNGEAAHSVGFVSEKKKNQVFKSCTTLLQRLMKHKYGWVFNEPVDAKALGLFDYHDIIKNPMDLGTIKTRLTQNLYTSPKEFAEDVRLVFYNAMTYNPKGQDVHIMAEQLLQIFEERWAIIETDYNRSRSWKYQMYQDGGLSTPTSRKATPQSQFSVGTPNHGLAPATLHASTYAPAPASTVPLYAPAAPQMRPIDRPDPVATTAVYPKFYRPHAGRTPVAKKPKAKDPDKRDMTYDEKQRLSNNLQGLPAEKLDAIVQIIKKRNTALSQHDDEIEVDIDNVDPETLWELDRFVTNYKKSLSKNKRKAELALQARMAANQNSISTIKTPKVAETQIGNGTEKSVAHTAGEAQGYDRSNSSSSSSSSSDSGSSSSDSDSDSSSADGSDAGQSPRT